MNIKTQAQTLAEAFGQKNTKGAVIRHCIRREPMHVGQLSWIIKAAGGKMV